MKLLVIGALALHPVRPATPRGPETGHGFGHRFLSVMQTRQEYGTFLCEKEQLTKHPECCKTGAKFECRYLSESFYMTCTTAKGPAWVVTPSFTKSSSEPLPRPLWRYGFIPAGRQCVKGLVLVDNLIGAKAHATPVIGLNWVVDWPRENR